MVALASPERFVVGLDISSTAVEKAKQVSCSRVLDITYEKLC